MEAWLDLKGGFHANDLADCRTPARIGRRRWLLRISQMGNGWRYRDFRAGADPSGAVLCLRRNSNALKKPRGVWCSNAKECCSVRRQIRRGHSHGRLQFAIPAWEARTYPFVCPKCEAGSERLAGQSPKGQLIEVGVCGAVVVRIKIPGNPTGNSGQYRRIADKGERR